MAEFVLAPVAQSIIDKLGSEVLKHIGILFGLDKELESLQETVSIIKGTVMMAENQLDIEIPPEMKVMLSNLSDAVYDADDLVDDFHTEALRLQVMTGNKFTKKVRHFFPSSNRPVYVYKMNRKLKAIRARLNKIATDWSKFGSPNILGKDISFPKIDIPETVSCVPDVVIGREKDIYTLVELFLKSNNSNVEVISLIGMGGMGKTTIAQRVFNDEKIQTHFQLKMWVSVSVNFNVNLIAQQVLERATNRKPEENLLLETIRDHLEKELTGRVYFLVLDDVWNENVEQWKRLKSLLAVGANGSKLLLTTRSERVAEITDSLKHKLTGLNEEESWSLFHQVTFNQMEGASSQANPDLTAMGKKIVERCGGNPLVIKTIGRLLHSKCTNFQWKNFMDELPNIVQEEQDVLRTLKLSYNYLPPHLKNCFIYCALFPEDYRIEKDKLIQLWMAQGFVRDEDDGNESFKALFWRSFFEAEEREGDNILICKMHDLMRDLSRLVAGEQMVTLNKEAKIIGKKTRHVSIGFQLNPSWKLPKSFQNVKKIRTFLLPCQHLYIESEKDSTKSFISFSSLKGLRSLDLHNMEIKSVPGFIHKLKHVRYLDLSGNTELKSLPNCITRLQNLQTLKLNGCLKLLELPRDFRKLINLMHLEIKCCYSLSQMPIGIGELTSLQTLSKFILNENDESRKFGGLSELGGLNNLRKLSISGLEHVKDVASAQAANLKRKHLQKLRLEWNISAQVGDIDELMLEELRPQPILKEMEIESYKGEFPNWLSDDILPCFPNLVRVLFRNCKKCRHLSALSQLPYLKYLELIRLDSVEYVIDNNNKSEVPTSNMANDGGKLVSQSSTSFFPSLEELHMSFMPNLKGWLREGENKSQQQYNIHKAGHSFFPRLIRLNLQKCPELECVALFPEVQTLYINRVSEKVLVDKQLPIMKSLHQLYLIGIENMVTLPEWLKNVITLHNLLIGYCSKLEKIPEWISSLESLQILQIHNCGDVIGKRCKKEIGEDWAHIKHIPHIFIDE